VALPEPEDLPEEALGARERLSERETRLVAAPMALALRELDVAALAPSAVDATEVPPPAVPPPEAPLPSEDVAEEADADDPPPVEETLPPSAPTELLEEDRDCTEEPLRPKPLRLPRNCGAINET
jgi:hypothetical protein